MMNFKRNLPSLNGQNRNLKNEFFGIDNVIDRVIDLISSWYSLPQLQTKPLIINLWGMTGIGKTSLVERIVSLLEIDDKHFTFDLGDSDNLNRHFGLRSTLEEIYKIHENSPIILSFDEFQYSRSINELNHEVSDSGSRLIWEILGSGKFSFSPSYQEIFELTRYVKFLKYQLYKGRKVENGIVTENPENYEHDHDRSAFMYSSLNDEFSFFSSIYLDNLFEILDGRFSSQLELSDYLLTLDGQETVDFLQESMSKASVKKTVDCSKALVFIIGNLDEAYDISGNFNPDISADIFYEETQKISLTKIKKVLRKRFRNEQIARLGNNHIIYPSLNSDAFNSIIKLELQKTCKLIKSRFGVDVDFDKSVNDLIYKEGVFPTQGARPLHTTIDNLIGSNISKILYLAKINEVSFNAIGIYIQGENLCIEYYFNAIKQYETLIQLTLSTENRRKSKNDELQAIIAVHESGHAILMKALQNIDPDGIISVSADDNGGGITLTQGNKDKIISKRKIIDENAVNLAGFIAEKLVFGEENISSGSINDIERTTEFTALMLKKAGLGKNIGSFELDQNFHLLYQNPEIEEEISDIIKFAALKAEEILKANYRLLLKLSDYLSKNSFMSKEQFLSHYELYSELYHCVEDENFYRNKLRDELKEFEQLQLKFTGTDD